MTAGGVGPAMLGTAVLLAILIVRTAVRDMREPGTARREWAFLHDRRALIATVASAVALGALAWVCTGPAGVPWAVLAGLFVARLSSR